MSFSMRWSSAMCLFQRNLNVDLVWEPSSLTAAYGTRMTARILKSLERKTATRKSKGIVMSRMSNDVLSKGLETSLDLI